jgi:hypothetical protein
MLRSAQQLALAALLVLSAASTALAEPIVRKAAGPDAASIQAAVDAFRTDLGGANNGGGGSYPDGRREIGWDGVSAEFSSPNNMPADLFLNSRGALFETPGTGFQVSASAGTAPIEFDNLNPTYSAKFQPFSPQKLFTAIGSPITDVLFFIPGTQTRATTKGFGVVFTGVNRRVSTRVEYFDLAGNLVYTAYAPVSREGTEPLSFVGVTFDAETPIARVRITSGNVVPGAQGNDGRIRDVVVMDDFIYGEPIAVAAPSGQ